MRLACSYPIAGNTCHFLHLGIQNMAWGVCRILGVLPAGAHRKGTRAAPRHTVALHRPPAVQQSQGPFRWIDMQCLCFPHVLLCIAAGPWPPVQMYSACTFPLELPAQHVDAAWLWPHPHCLCSRKCPERPSNVPVRLQRLSCQAPHCLLYTEPPTAPALALHTCSLGAACLWPCPPSLLLLRPPSSCDWLIAACRWRPKLGSSGDSRQ